MSQTNQGGIRETGSLLGDSLAHWTLLQGAKFTYAIHPEMLTDDGHVKTLDCRLIGETKSRNGSKLRQVAFDRDYVIQKLAKDLGPLFDGCDYAEIQRLVSQAKKYRQSR